MATSHAKATCQRTRWHNAGALSGSSGPPEAGGPPTAHGCQTGSFLQTELSHREGRQHRDLHPRGPDAALRSILQHLLCPPPTTPPRQPAHASHPAFFQLPLRHITRPSQPAPPLPFLCAPDWSYSRRVCCSSNCRVVQLAARATGI